jgi:hypothetical protein
MSIQLKISENDDVANDILTAADMIKAASQSLRNSYLIDTKGDELDNLRAEVLNKAILYNDKIMPFSHVTITNIKQFCDDIQQFDCKKFEKHIHRMTTNAKSSLELCGYTVLFNDRILTEFTIIEDKARKFFAKEGLTAKYERKRDEVISTGAKAMEQIDKLASSAAICNETQIQDFTSKMEPLIRSITQYTESLRKISGFFFNLHGDLVNIKTKTDQIDKNSSIDDIEYFYDTVNPKAKEIVPACNTYLKIYPECKSNLHGIIEHRIEHIDGWILDIINTHRKEKYNEFKALVYKNGHLLYGICKFD